VVIIELLDIKSHPKRNTLEAWHLNKRNLKPVRTIKSGLKRGTKYRTRDHERG